MVGRAGLEKDEDALTHCACMRLHGCCAVDDDILLEVVMFVGVLCNEGTAPLLVESGLVSGRGLKAWG